jgi:hypothetical protein
MATEVSGIKVTVDDDANTERVDPVTGTVEQDQPDGGVVVRLDARRPQKKDGPKEFYRNLVDEIDGRTLGTIGEELHEAISADDRSRGNYLQIRARAMDFMGLELKEPSSGLADTSAAVEGQSVVTNPLLLEACLKGWANAQAELLPADGPVKVEDQGTEISEDEDELADALERDINHYLTDTASEYYPDTSHMLLWGTYFGGSGFKKIYRCPLRRRPVSESVDAKDFIVSDTTKDLRSCGRVTHQIPMRPSVLKRMIVLGAYRNFPQTQQPTPTPNAVDEKIHDIQGTEPAKRPEDQPYTIWESQCELDLPEFATGKFKDEGIPLPYLVTIDKETRHILAVRRDWKEKDELAERKRMYIKYPYVPGPGFYGTGMLNILGNASAAMTAAWRIALDTGMFANFPSGLISKIAGRQNTSDIRLAAGVLQPVETGGQDIRQTIMPLPYKDITPGILALMDKITSQCQQLGGSPDIPTAEGVQNVPVGTMMAQIEQATKVMFATHKGMHRAQAEELGLIVDLFRENPEDFWRANKICPKGYWDDAKFVQAIESCNLVPRSDPNTPSHIHRVAKSVGMAQLFNVPAFQSRLDAGVALKRIMFALREDPRGLVIEPAAAPAAPDPQLIAAQAKIMSAQTNQTKAQADAQNAQQELQIKQAQMQGERDIATTDLAKEMIIHQSDSVQAAHDMALEQNTQAHQRRIHGLNVAKANHDAAMDQAQHAHDVTMDHAEHALNVHEVLHPPKLAKPGK